MEGEVDADPFIDAETALWYSWLQYFGHLMRKTEYLEKTLMLGKTEGRRSRGWQRMRWLDGITDSMDMSLGKSRSWWWTGKPGMLQSMGSQRVGHDWLNWTELSSFILSAKPAQVTELIWAVVAKPAEWQSPYFCQYEKLPQNSWPSLTSFCLFKKRLDLGNPRW